MAFSRKIADQQVLDMKIRRAKTMAKSSGNPDFNIAHPAYVRDAAAKKFTQLESEIRDSVLKRQKQAKDRRLKQVGKN